VDSLVISVLSKHLLWAKGSGLCLRHGLGSFQTFLIFQIWDKPDALEQRSAGKESRKIYFFGKSHDFHGKLDFLNVGKGNMYTVKF
jgi:hypothetical protein